MNGGSLLEITSTFYWKMSDITDIYFHLINTLIYWKMSDITDGYLYLLNAFNFTIKKELVI